jgi:hypothetical protein
MSSNTPNTAQLFQKFHQLPQKQQSYLVKTVEMMQLKGRTDHHFKLIQGDTTIYDGNDPQAALNALSNLRRTAIEQLKAGKADIHAFLQCQYPNGHTEIVGEV